MTEFTWLKAPPKYLRGANIREKGLYKLKDYAGTRIHYSKLVINTFTGWFLNIQSMKFLNYFPNSIVRARIIHFSGGFG